MTNETLQDRVSLGRVSVPIRFADQVITSLLFNHDSNPAHHKPEHAVQWMLGLFAGTAGGFEDYELERASPEERTYTLGMRLLMREEFVVMPGAVLAAICAECFIPPEEHLVYVTTTFTYPLLVSARGEIEVRIEGFELPLTGTAPAIDGKRPRNLLIEAYGPGLSPNPVKLLKLEALVYPRECDPNAVFERVVAEEFVELEHKKNDNGSLPSLSHPAAISEEDRRRYACIIDLDRRITPLTWQTKIPRVLTEIQDYMGKHKAYQAEMRAYYEGRADEANRREAIARYVAKEVKYRCIAPSKVGEVIEELANRPQLLYARQHTVFDPRLFVEGGRAVKSATPFFMDLHLHSLRPRRGIHRFYTGARLGDQPVFKGEATVTGQPLVTRELANFLCEINYSFNTLRPFQYRTR